jgi:hypothetical protein
MLVISGWGLPEGGLLRFFDWRKGLARGRFKRKEKLAIWELMWRESGGKEDRKLSEMAKRPAYKTETKKGPSEHSTSGLVWGRPDWGR